MCFKCVTPIEKENEPDSVLKCIICTENFHPNCVNITKKFLKTVLPHKGFCWTCSDCTDRRDELSGITKRLKNIELILRRLENGQKCHEKEISSLKVNAKQSDISATPFSSAKRKWSDIMRDDNTPTSGNSIKRNKVMLPVSPKREPIIIVRAKNTPDKKMTKETVGKLLHPVNDPVKRMQTNSKGDVIVVCNNQQSIDTVKNKISEKLGSDYDVTEPKELNPRIKIVGFDSDYCDCDKFIDAITVQNSDIFTDKSTIKLVDKPMSRPNGRCTAMIDVDMETFKRVLQKHKLKIGWNSCPVYEQVNVVRCYRCSAFNHFASECKSERMYCCLCSGDHSLNDCGTKESKKDLKCINCCRANDEYGTDVDVNHSAMSMQCPVLCKKVEQRKRMIRYKS